MSFSSRKKSILPHIISLLVSVVIATAMWYTVSVRDRIEAQFEVNINYVGIPKNLIVTDGLINKVTVRMRGPQTLLRGIANQRLNQKIDLSMIKKGVTIVPLNTEHMAAYYRAFEVLDVQPPRIVVNADVVTAFSICILLIVVLGIEKNTFIPLVIGHVVLCTPFVYLAVMPKLKQMDNGLYEAALELGATPFQALYKVVIPQLIPGIVSGFMLSITLSLDDYFISTYTKPATFDTISTYVVNATRGAQTEIKTALWALSTVIFLVVILAVVIMNLAAAGTEKKQEVSAYEGREKV